jgi:hypothetical protein
MRLSIVSSHLYPIYHGWRDSYPGNSGEGAGNPPDGALWSLDPSSQGYLATVTILVTMVNVGTRNCNSSGLYTYGGKRHYPSTLGNIHASWAMSPSTRELLQ